MELWGVAGCAAEACPGGGRRRGRPAARVDGGSDGRQPSVKEDGKGSRRRRSMTAVAGTSATPPAILRSKTCSGGDTAGAVAVRFQDNEQSNPSGGRLAVRLHGDKEHIPDPFTLVQPLNC